MSSVGFAGYTAGQCTWYVARTLDWIGQWGDAYQWIGRAQADGRQISSVPVIGSVAVWGQNAGGARDAGHVGIVTGIDNHGAPIVSEMNWTNGPWRSDSRDTGADGSASGIIGYILPPGGSVPSGGMLQTGAIPAGGSPVESLPGQRTSEVSGVECLSLRDMIEVHSSSVPGSAAITGTVSWIAQPCTYKRAGLMLVAVGMVLVGLKLAGEGEPMRIVTAPVRAAGKATGEAVKAV